ncbi:uncharacterized protein LOC125382142 [Haliotis rufescens]|uniref:uncharacterized protein LOC125382142 n=1 Tax=Haliotis rufescens TaxID=6454 RepID=UPI00201F28B2|nr:uncharacterized protein LOC125382142 [Haliotis rufescens]
MDTPVDIGTIKVIIATGTWILLWTLVPSRSLLLEHGYSCGHWYHQGHHCYWNMGTPVHIGTIKVIATGTWILLWTLAPSRSLLLEHGYSCGHWYHQGHHCYWNVNTPVDIGTIQVIATGTWVLLWTLVPSRSLLLEHGYSCGHWYHQGHCFWNMGTPVDIGTIKGIATGTWILLWTLVPSRSSLLLEHGYSCGHWYHQGHCYWNMDTPVDISTIKVIIATGTWVLLWTLVISRSLLLEHGYSCGHWYHQGHCYWNMDTPVDIGTIKVIATGSWVLLWTLVPSRSSLLLEHGYSCGHWYHKDLQGYWNVNTSVDIVPP